MRVAVSFTGGKDSCLCLHLLRATVLPPDLPESVKLRLAELCDSSRASVAPVECKISAAQRHETDRPPGAALATVSNCPEAASSVLMGERPTVELLVTFAPIGGAGAFKAHPLSLVQLQVQALGIEHCIIEVGPPYIESYRSAIAELGRSHGIKALVTGDIADVCNGFMSRAAEGSGVQLSSPLWGVDRHALLSMVWFYGLQPLISCVDLYRFGRAPKTGIGAAEAACAAAPCMISTEQHALDVSKQFGGTGMGSTSLDDPLHSLLGQVLDPTLARGALARAAAQFGVDECGEAGEFHTVVVDGQLFKATLVVGFNPDAPAIDENGQYACLCLNGTAHLVTK